MEFDGAQLQRFYQYCHALTRHQHDAYDLLHTGIEKYLACPPARPDRGEAYLFRILRNCYIDHYRREQHRHSESYDDDLHSVDIAIGTLEGVFIEARTLEELLPQLADIEREILFLWAVLGYSTAEVAELMELPKGSVLSRIHRLRQRLTRAVEGEQNVAGISR